MQEIASQCGRRLSPLVPRVMMEGMITVTLQDLLADEEGGWSVTRLPDVLGFIESFGMELFPPASEGPVDTQRLLRRRLGEDRLREQVRETIVRGVIATVELKSSLRYDYEIAALGIGRERETKAWMSIRDEVMKAICAFYNTDGGQILVGVSESKNVLGVEADYPLVRRANSGSSDVAAWLERFKEDLADCFVDPVALKRCVHAEAVEIQGKTVIRIQVGRGQSLGFIRLSDAKCGHPEAFVREFVTSRALQPHEIEGHVLAREADDIGRRPRAVRSVEVSAA
jgi:hypothetical protein